MKKNFFWLPLVRPPGRRLPPRWSYIIIKYIKEKFNDDVKNEIEMSAVSTPVKQKNIHVFVEKNLSPINKRPITSKTVEDGAETDNDCGKTESTETSTLDTPTPTPPPLRPPLSTTTSPAPPTSSPPPTSPSFAPPTAPSFPPAPPLPATPPPAPAAVEEESGLGKETKHLNDDVETGEGFHETEDIVNNEVETDDNVQDTNKKGKERATLTVVDGENVEAEDQQNPPDDSLVAMLDGDDDVDEHDDNLVESDEKYEEDERCVEDDLINLTVEPDTNSDKVTNFHVEHQSGDDSAGKLAVTGNPQIQDSEKVTLELPSLGHEVVPVKDKPFVVDNGDKRSQKRKSDELDEEKVVKVHNKRYVFHRHEFVFQTEQFV